MAEAADPNDAGLRPAAAGQLALIRTDYEQSLRFIDGVVRISSTVRQTTITASLALIGLSIENQSPALAIAAASLGVLMGLLDGYHGWLYSTALARVTSIEGIFRQEKAVWSRPEDEQIADRLDEMLDDFQIGVVSHLGRFSLGKLRDARPPMMYLIYPLALAGGIIAATVCK